VCGTIIMEEIGLICLFANIKVKTQKKSCSGSKNNNNF
jgi:hypothetical protein